MSAVGWAALAILAAVLGAEVIAWCGPAQRWLLRRAANALPVEHRDRYVEEWIAELAYVPNGPVTRLLWAGRIFVGRNSIARALGAPVRSTSRTLTAKRGLDMAAAAASLIVSAFVLIGIALAIRLDSSGPILFRQTRVGKNGLPFEMLKFRTRVASGVDSAAAQDSDFQFTRVGRVLRRYSLDELPQLINVLRGDVSMVGPRPWLIGEWGTDSIKDIQSIEPGLTGLWQVSDRSDLSPEEVVRLDLRYVHNRSMVMDFVIIYKTIVAALNSKPAPPASSRKG